MKRKEMIDELVVQAFSVLSPDSAIGLNWNPDSTDPEAIANRDNLRERFSKVLSRYERKKKGTP